MLGLGDDIAWLKGFRLLAITIRYSTLAKPNYQFEKRQRDLAKKAKQDEKRRQKLAATAAADSHGAPTAPDPTLAPAQTADLPDAKAPDSSAKPEP